MAVSSGPSTPPRPPTMWHDAQPLRLVQRRAALRRCPAADARGSRPSERTYAAVCHAMVLGQRAGERRHFRPRNAVRTMLTSVSIGGRVTQRCAVEIRSGSASAAGAMAPGALRVEDLLAGGDVARRGRGERSRAAPPRSPARTGTPRGTSRRTVESCADYRVRTAARFRPILVTISAASRESWSGGTVRRSSSNRSCSMRAIDRRRQAAQPRLERVRRQPVPARSRPATSAAPRPARCRRRRPTRPPTSSARQPAMPPMRVGQRVGARADLVGGHRQHPLHRHGRLPRGRRRTRPASLRARRRSSCRRAARASADACGCGRPAPRGRR